MINNANKLWEDCLKLIKDSVGEQQYQTWFASLNFDSYNPDKQILKLQVPSKVVIDYLEENYIGILRSALIHFFGKNIRLSYLVNAEKKTDSQTSNNNIKGVEAVNTVFDSGLDESRTFDTFIKGKSNMLPRSIGESIAENSSQTLFNPFFVFGPSGSGKTHLINAIGVKLKEKCPQKRVLYISARLFQVQYTNAVLNNSSNDFINFYQTIDVLIIDDVQEWLTAVKTQETFFHIFNHLFRNGKRIILASDRPPVDLKGMSDRLLTRLKCGLVAQLDKPDVQLCKDILRARINNYGLNVTHDIIDYIAETANGSVRDLEGSLNSLMANALVYKCNISMEMAQKAVRNLVHTDKGELTIDDILEVVCRHYNIRQEDVSGKSRKQEIVSARQVAMYLADKHTDRSRSYIGRKIANRDHATVIHSCEKILQRLNEDKFFKKEIEEIEHSLL